MVLIKSQYLYLYLKNKTDKINIIKKQFVY